MKQHEIQGLDIGGDSSDSRAWLWQAISEARREINLRIAIQNVVVIVNCLQIGVWMLILITTPADVLLLWVSAAMLSLMLGLIWVHSGVRHAQYRQYLLDVLESRLDYGMLGWESALKRLRPKSVSGSRWWLSTKGQFAFGPTVIVLVGLLESVEMGGRSLGSTFGIFVGSILVGCVVAIVLIHPQIPRLGDEAVADD